MARIDTSCPACGAPHAKRLSQIYSEGLTTTSGKFESVGTLNTIGRQKIHTKGASSGFHQTEASKAASPPSVPEFMSKGKKRQYTVAGAGLGACLLIGFPLVLNYQSVVAGVATIIGAVGVLAAMKAIDAKPTLGEVEAHKARFPGAYAAYEQWERSFKCQSCGERFVPQEVS